MRAPWASLARLPLAGVTQQRPGSAERCRAEEGPFYGRQWRCFWYSCLLALALDNPPSARLQVKRVFCESSGALVPKDKAVARFIVRNIVESAAIRDLQESCVFDCARPHAICRCRCTGLHDT